MFTRRVVLSGLLASSLPWSVAAKAKTSAPAALGDGWLVEKPADAGLNPEALAELSRMIDAGGTVPNIHAVLIEHKGRLVFESYWSGEDWGWAQPIGRVDHGPMTLHNLRSVTKSVTSLLLGIALDGINEDVLERPITRFFPNRKDLASGLDAVTLHHVLTMTAGLAWNETIVPYSRKNNDFFKLARTDDPVGYVLGKELSDKPGRRWNYNSGLTDITGGIIENLTGMPLATYAQRVMFEPLGITDYEWHRPSAWGSDSFPSAGAGLRMRARDLAKIGSLVLHDGQWQGRQIVPADWIKTSTAAHVINDRGAFDYGYFWYAGRLTSGEQAIRASGYGGQEIFVLPDAELAVTIFAGNYDNYDWIVGERNAGRIVRALG